MTSLAAPFDNFPAMNRRRTDAGNTDAATVLRSEQQAEALAFLAQHSLHNVCMMSMIRDNGLVSPLNRGAFYASRNAQGQLEGVALIGHATLFCAHTEGALAAFARLARQSPRAYMLMGEQEEIERFWRYYREGGQQPPHVICRELLLEQRWPVMVREAVPGLRQATLDDLELVMPVHAALAFAESGVNPLEVDSLGFRLRCARRIEQGRTWVLVAGQRLIFKVDVQSDTPDVIYLEGAWVNPQERGNGYGKRCMSQLERKFLERTQSVCVLVNEQNEHAQRLYLGNGYRLRDLYDTIFLRRQAN